MTKKTDNFSFIVDNFSFIVVGVAGLVAACLIAATSTTSTWRADSWLILVASFLSGVALASAFWQSYCKRILYRLNTETQGTLNELRRASEARESAMQFLVKETRINAIRQYMESTNEAPSVLNAVISYLERGDEEAAKRKVRLDADKFSRRKATLSFLDYLGLVSDEHKALLTWWE